MFSRLLTKLIDQAIVPALLLVVSRITSVILISQNLGVQYSITSNGLVFTDNQSYELINTYSLLAMLLVLAGGFMYFLLKAYFLHDSHITPKATAKVFSFRIQSLIQNSFELYTQGAIWLSYIYLLTLTAGLMGYFQMIYMWVFYIGFVLSVFFTVVLVIDIEKELKVSKKGRSVFDEDARFLEE